MFSKLMSLIKKVRAKSALAYNIFKYTSVNDENIIEINLPENIKFSGLKRIILDDNILIVGNRHMFIQTGGSLFLNPKLDMNETLDENARKIESENIEFAKTGLKSLAASLINDAKEGN